MLTGAEVDVEVKAASAINNWHAETAQAGEAHFVPGGDPLKLVQTLNTAAEKDLFEQVCVCETAFWENMVRVFWKEYCSFFKLRFGAVFICRE